MKKEYCRIFGIVAREAPICLLFRRGTTKWWQLVQWNTDNNNFKEGHWFKGRVYQRRCDLSPDGKYLIYFVSKFNRKTIADVNGYTYAWTAISKIPYYKAELLIPKGDCWHGGGLFLSNKEVWLNHKPEVAIPHPNHKNNQFKIIPNSNAIGEDAPIYNRRLIRDGWECVQEGIFKTSKTGWYGEKAEIWEKEGKNNKKLRRELIKYDYESYGDTYVENFYLIPKNKNPIKIEGATWADLDYRLKLIFAREGKIYIAILNHS